MHECMKSRRTQGAVLRDWDCASGSISPHYCNSTPRSVQASGCRQRNDRKKERKQQEKGGDIANHGFFPWHMDGFS